MGPIGYKFSAYNQIRRWRILIFQVAPGLDTIYPYEVGTYAEDTPGNPLLTSAHETEEIGSGTFLMWNSQTDSSIEVPIGFVQWNVAGDAHYNSTSQLWTLQQVLAAWEDKTPLARNDWICRAVRIDEHSVV